MGDPHRIWSSIVDVNAVLGPIINAMAPVERAGIRNAVVEGFAPFQAGARSYSVPAESLAVVAD